MLGGQRIGIYFIRPIIKNRVCKLCHQVILHHTLDRVLNHFLFDVFARDIVSPNGDHIQEFLHSWKLFRVMRIRLTHEFVENRANSVFPAGAQKWLDIVEIWADVIEASIVGDARRILDVEKWWLIFIYIHYLKFK